MTLQRPYSLLGIHKLLASVIHHNDIPTIPAQQRAPTGGACWRSGERRLRMSLASLSPGASGDTARPNYVGPSGNGLVGADERGGKPAESRAYRMGAPVRFQKAVSRSKENVAVGRREARRSASWIGNPVR